MIRFTGCCFCPLLIENASQRSEFESRYVVYDLGNASCWYSSRQKGTDDVTSCITLFPSLGFAGVRPRCFNGLKKFG